MCNSYLFYFIFGIYVNTLFAMSRLYAFSPWGSILYIFASLHWSVFEYISLLCLLYLCCKMHVVRHCMNVVFLISFLVIRGVGLRGLPGGGTQACRPS